MVFELHLRHRHRLQALILAAATFVWAADLGKVAQAADDGRSAREMLTEAQTLYQNGQYFKAARYAFAADEKDGALKAEAYAWITLSLVRARLYNAASYFFIKTLQAGDRNQIRRVLTHTQDILIHVGGDLLRRYLIDHTKYEDYDARNRSAYLYSLAKEALLRSNEEKAIGYVNGMSSSSPLWPFALQIRAAAKAIQGSSESAIADFEECAGQTKHYAAYNDDSAEYAKHRSREADDLRSRCAAGKARTLYQMGQFPDADQTYDLIRKSSFVWTDILFEQAWNAFARQEFNRTLGKLVSYKSPALGFVFNTEVDVLRAQSFLALCLYADANVVINEFNSKYARVGEDVKRFVERNSTNLNNFYETGKDALREPLHTRNDFFRMMNRFIRSPYFQNLVAAERAIDSEAALIKRFDSSQLGVKHSVGAGFPGFVDLVLGWRKKTIKQLGGAFVKNSMIDYHTVLISDFEKMAFIKLEMLSRAKQSLMGLKSLGADRLRGNVEPTRQGYQYFWSFNGEFWNDELGDYVFGLESECRS